MPKNVRVFGGSPLTTLHYSLFETGNKQKNKYNCVIKKLQNFRI